MCSGIVRSGLRILVDTLLSNQTTDIPLQGYLHPIATYSPAWEADPAPGSEVL